MVRFKVESICSSINNSLYRQGDKNRLEDIEAKYCGDFMIKVNKDNLTTQTWSLRDIHKILLRLKYQIEYSDKYKDIGTAVNLLYYSLSSTTVEQLNDEVVDK